MVAPALRKGWVLSLALVLLFPAGVSQEPPTVLYEDLKDQFRIRLPAGWNTYDQLWRPATGQMGMVIFAPVDFKALVAQKDALLTTVVKLDVGEIPSFFVDRIPARSGMSCKELPKKWHKEILQMIERGSWSGKEWKTLGQFSAELASVGGCNGIKIQGRKKSGEGLEGVVEVYAVSDGRVLFLFTLRNRQEHFEKNSKYFKEALVSLQMTAAESH